MLVWSMVLSFTSGVRLCSIIPWLCGEVGGSLHCLLQLDIRLSLGKVFAHLGDVMLQEVLVQRVRDLQPADKCECCYLLTTVGDLGELALEEIDVGFEAISWPQLDREKLVTTPLGFLASGVLCEEGLGDLQEVVEKRVVGSRTTLTPRSSNLKER